MVKDGARWAVWFQTPQSDMLLGCPATGTSNLNALCLRGWTVVILGIRVQFLGNSGCRGLRT